MAGIWDYSGKSVTIPGHLSMRFWLPLFNSLLTRSRAGIWDYSGKYLDIPQRGISLSLMTNLRAELFGGKFERCHNLLRQKFSV